MSYFPPPRVGDSGFAGGRLTLMMINKAGGESLPQATVAFRGLRFDNGRNLSAARKPLETTRKSGLRLARGRRELFVAVGGEDIVCQEPAGLVAPELVVMAAETQQLGVRAFLDDASRFEHDQPVHARDGRQAVRDRDHGLAFHQIEQLLLDRELDLAVERRGRLVEHQDRRVLEYYARERDALALPAGELDAALADVRLVARVAPPIS